jgi:hypothetical protein
VAKLKQMDDFTLRVWERAHISPKMLHENAWKIDAAINDPATRGACIAAIIATGGAIVAPTPSTIAEVRKLLPTPFICLNVLKECLSLMAEMREPITLDSVSARFMRAMNCDVEDPEDVNRHIRILNRIVKLVLDMVEDAGQMTTRARMRAEEAKRWRPEEAMQA